MRNLGRRLYYASLATIVKSLLSRRRRRIASAATPAPPQREFLESEEYEELMSRHLPFGAPFDPHEAQNDTLSYRFRHVGHHALKLGVFRWRGMQRNKELILRLLKEPGANVVDFGGAAGPLGLGSVLVDLLPTDVYGNPVRYSSLAEVPGDVTAIFCSHTLEHVPDLDDVLTQMARRLRAGGYLLAHVPAFTCEAWRVGRHRNVLHQDHVWTFGLVDSPVPEGLVNYTCIDVAVARHLNLVQSEYCGDDSIFVVAVK